MSERITWIDGLKGLACIGVFLHHFLLGFYPGVFEGTGAASHTAGNLESWFGSSPFSALVCGEYMVCIFCLLSGLVISYQMQRMNDQGKVSDFLIKRYPKLALPLFGVSIIVWLMLKFHLFTNTGIALLTKSTWLGNYYQSTQTFSDVIICSFLLVWFVMDNRFSNAFWMLKTLFIGSVISALLGQMAWKKNKKMYFVYGIAAGIAFWFDNMYLLFVMGTILSFTMIKNQEIKRGTWYKVAGWVLLVLGLYLGGYPTRMAPEGIYALIGRIFADRQAALTVHMFAAFFTVSGVYCLDILQKLLDTKFCRFMGKICYSFFLVHIPVLFSFSTWIFGLMLNGTNQYLLSATVALITGFLLTVGVSFVFNRYVEQNCYRAVNWLSSKLSIKIFS